MAQGDRKVKRTRRSSGDNYNWDARNRRDSKRWYDKVKQGGADYLLGLSAEALVRLWRDTRAIDRYGDIDWNRIAELVGEDVIIKVKARIEQHQADERKKSEERQKVYAQQLKAQRDEMVADARLSAGYIQSELATAIRYKESYGQPYGDWLDDPVSVLTGQGGFGEEVREEAGIKMEINICLDISNSMWHNGVDMVSVKATRTLYRMLEMAGEDLPEGSLTVRLWTWAGGEDGKNVQHLTDIIWSSRVNDENPLGVTLYLPSARYNWTGEDTWLYPLLEKIDNCEQREGDPGAYRLDLIISDGVLEHRTDPGKCDKIQEDRNGYLQTIILNFLPPSEWADYRVPDRCVQYPVTVDTLFGTLRSVLGDWIVSIT